MARRCATSSEIVLRDRSAALSPSGHACRQGFDNGRGRPSLAGKAFLMGRGRPSLAGKAFSMGRRRLSLAGKAFSMGRGRRSLAGKHRSRGEGCSALAGKGWTESRGLFRACREGWTDWWRLLEACRQGFGEVAGRAGFAGKALNSSETWYPLSESGGARSVSRGDGIEQHGGLVHQQG
jgi:hypothetical protein